MISLHGETIGVVLSTVLRPAKTASTRVTTALLEYLQLARTVQPLVGRNIFRNLLLNTVKILSSVIMDHILPSHLLDTPRTHTWKIATMFMVCPSVPQARDMPIDAIRVQITHSAHRTLSKRVGSVPALPKSTMKLDLHLSTDNMSPLQLPTVVN